MTLTISSPSQSPFMQRNVPRRATSHSGRSERVRGSRNRGCGDGSLGRYLDSEGRIREVIALPAVADSVLVVDRDAATGCERRLVAHLAPGEPSENAALVCDRYLYDVRGRWCRRLTPADAERAPFTDEEHMAECEAEIQRAGGVAPVDALGRRYELQALPSAMSIPELRWVRQSSHPACLIPVETVSVREAVASLESYEPVRAITRLALVGHRDDPMVSVSVLRSELDRVDASRIVLNRGLREAVLAAIDRDGVSMSEIAMRCGRVKRDSRGNLSGETSWLARRIGTLPEGGTSEPTPWVHSQVLALIAREGLGVSPREVELG